MATILEADPLDIKSREKTGADYSENSPKEELILLYVENFCKQFHSLYSDRKCPYMVALNENVTQKMVCTTIRPTGVKYQELSTWQGCAEFIADFVIYQKLEDPLEPPEVLQSPSAVIKSQKGHCFEMSTLLCSLLLGSGYDAYVVHGYATQDVCNLILDREVFPVQATVEEESVEVVKEEQQNKFHIKPIQEDYKSRYEDMMEKKSQMLQKKQRDKIKQMEDEKQAEIEKPPFDPLFGLRVHSWVLMKSGKHEVQKDFFIEPSKGWGIPITDEKYLGIESIWNNTNYWVNMQSCAEGVKHLRYDFHDEGMWEPFLPYTEISLPPVVVDPEAVEMDGNLPSIEQEVNDMPLTWAKAINLTKKELQNRYPGGQKTQLFKYQKVEKFAPYHMKDGLVLKVSTFATWDRHDLQLVEEHYERRADKMYYREHNYVTGFSTEYFNPGQPNSLKEHFYKTNDTGMQAMRKMIFYHNSRVDGLASREIKQDETIDYYQRRLDFLKFRQTWFGKRVKKFGPVESAKKQILKIHESYYRNPAIPASKDKAEIIYMIAENKIKVIYHQEENKITCSWQEFIKSQDLDEQKTDVRDFTLDFLTQFSADPESKPITRLEAYMILHALMKSEVHSISRIREDENELLNLLNARIHEESASNLYVSPYNFVRGEKTRRLRLEKEHRELQDKLSQEKDQDYLLPYLLKYDIQEGDKITRSQAAGIMESCLSDFKANLLRKASFIQQRYEKGSKDLKEKQQWYHQKQTAMKPEEEQEYNMQCKEMIFKLQVIESRLIQFREVAAQRYLSLEKKLKSDPRLKFLLV